VIVSRVPADVPKERISFSYRCTTGHGSLLCNIRRNPLERGLPHPPPGGPASALQHSQREAEGVVATLSASRCVAPSLMGSGDCYLYCGARRRSDITDEIISEGVSSRTWEFSLRRVKGVAYKWRVNSLRIIFIQKDTASFAF